jgi:hypothetical protein
MKKRLLACTAVLCAILFSLTVAHAEVIPHATANCKYISYMENWYIHDDSMPIDKLYKVFVYMYPSLNCTGQAFGPSTYYYHNYFF